MNPRKREGFALHLPSFSNKRAKSPAPPAGTDSVASTATPASSSDNARSQLPNFHQTTFQSVKDVVYDVLSAARDASDLLLPLKAALTGVIKVWDVLEVPVILLP